MGRVTDYTVVDLEMTGLQPKMDRVIEIGAIRVRDGIVVSTYSMLVNPGMVIPQNVCELTGITNEQAALGEDMDKAMSGLIDFIGNDVLVGHNINFDYSFIKQWAINKKQPLELKAYDTLKIARSVLPPEQSKKLEDLCVFFQIERENAHRALDDARETGLIFEKLMDQVVGTDMEKHLNMFTLSYKAKRQTPATAHQKERLREYREANGITEAINWETLTRSEASRLYDIYRSRVNNV